MSGGYTKLFASITDSTIWQASDATRIVWITMLSMADQHGYVGASVPGLANRARVNLQDCLTALETLSTPDEWSRTPDFEGRRITVVDGGWVLLNHAKYRAMRDADERREQARIAMAKLRAERKGVTVSNVIHGEPPLAQAEAEATTTLSDKSDVSPSQMKKNGFQQEAKGILLFLNEKTGKNYQPVKANVELIVARLQEGFTTTQLRQVVAKKSREWKPDEKMVQYLRPKTLFNRSNFANYCGELVDAVS